MKWLTLATIVAAAGSFVILILSAWGLAADVNIQFVAYWGVFFAVTGVLGGLMQETTRAVGSSLRDGSGSVAAAPSLDDVPAPPRTIRARPMTVALGVAAATFLLFAASGPLWINLVVHDHHVLAIVLMAGGLAMYAMQATVSGVLSGAKLWGQYATLIILDILTRVVPAVVAWRLGWGLGAWLWITVIGTISWVLLAAVSPATRRAMTLRADVPVRRFLPLMITAMGAAGASAVLITGFPALIKIAAEHGAGATGSVTAIAIAYAVTLTRAPLLMPLEKFQNAIIVHFVHRDGGPLGALAKPLGALFAFGLFGSALAWLIGPWILEVILNPDYYAPGRTLAGLTLGATFTALLMVTGAVTLAVARHRAYLAGWLLATIIAAAILFGPGTLELRSVLALIIGPAIGVILHLAVLKAAVPDRPEPGPDRVNP